MRITKHELSLISGRPTSDFGDDLVAALRSTLDKYEITTPLRVVHFLAQVMHESASFRHAREVGDGSQYEMRSDLGNTEPGWGRKYLGRGFIQLTGHYNYMRYGQYTGRDFVEHPELVEQLPWSMDVAGWYWHTRGLNALADRDDVYEITRKINGGLNGISQRKELLYQASAVFMPTRLGIRPGADLVGDRPTSNVLPHDAPAPPAVPRPPDSEKATPEKPWWLSRTLIGIALTGVSLVVKGFDFGDAWSLAAEVTTAGGLLWAAYGRIVAKHRLTR